jgi:hypothetical protein
MGYGKHFWDIVYSPDDDGWYVQVYDEVGRELHATDVCSSKAKASAAAKAWCHSNGIPRWRILSSD